MHGVSQLPATFQKRFHNWQATTFAENKSWYKRLADEGQRPRAMVISCCDSRVQATSLFGAEEGEFFIHRNIANLVPPYQPDGAQHGTSAAIEYAVTVLNVVNLIVLGHSKCGGVQGCIDMCKGNAPDLERPDSFVGRWMDVLRHRFDQVAEIADPGEQAGALEKLGILNSLENLMTFPFVAEAVERGALTMHGVWTDISLGTLSTYDPNADDFIQI